MLYDRLYVLDTYEAWTLIYVKYLTAEIGNLEAKLGRRNEFS